MSNFANPELDNSFRRIILPSNTAASPSIVFANDPTVGLYWDLAGIHLSGLSATPTDPTEAASKAYVDNSAGGGGVSNPMTSNLDAGTFEITDLGNVTLNSGSHLNLAGATVDFSGNNTDGLLTFDGNGLHLSGITTNYLTDGIGSFGSFVSGALNAAIQLNGNGGTSAVDIYSTQNEIVFNDTTVEILFNPAFTTAAKINSTGLLFPDLKTISWGTSPTTIQGNDSLGLIIGTGSGTTELYATTGLDIWADVSSTNKINLAVADSFTVTLGTPAHVSLQCDASTTPGDTRAKVWNVNSAALETVVTTSMIVAFSGAKTILSSPQTVSSNSYLITWDATEFDTSSFWNVTPNPSRVTIPGNGIYRIFGTLVYSSNSLGSVDLRLNGTTALLITQFGNGGSNNSFDLNWIGTLSASDYIEVIFNNSTSGGTLSTTSFFAIEKVKSN